MDSKSIREEVNRRFRAMVISNVIDLHAERHVKYAQTNNCICEECVSKRERARSGYWRVEMVRKRKDGISC